jgi:hypothetical protein
MWTLGFFTLFLKLCSAYYVCTDPITKIHYDSSRITHVYPSHLISKKSVCTTSCGPCKELGEVSIGYTAWCSPNALHRLMYGLTKTTSKTYYTPLPKQYGIFESRPKHPFITYSHLCIFDTEEEKEKPVLYQKRYSNTKHRPLPTVMMQLPK